MKILNIQKIYQIEYGLKYIKIDNSKKLESHKAWIYVNILNNKNNKLMQDFKEKEFKGVLTWLNSD